MNRAEPIIRQAQAGDIDGLLPLLQLLFAIEEDFTFDEKRQRDGLNLLLNSATSCIAVAWKLPKVAACSVCAAISTARLSG